MYPIDRKKASSILRLKTAKRSHIFNPEDGRRSAQDRRKSAMREYFLSGGEERRSWKERRYVWYMTA